MAHIQKRNRGGRVRWVARVPGLGGAELTKTFDRKVDAERWLTSVESSKLDGSFVDPRAGRRRFSDYAHAWLETKVNVAPRTLENIDARLRNHALPYFGSTPLAQIRPEHVRGFVTELVSKGLAPSTVKDAYLTVAQVLRQAVIDGLIVRSPCIGIELPRNRSGQEVLYLTAEEVNDLADAIDDRFRTLVYTASYGGLRAGECHALSVDRLDLSAGTLQVAVSASWPNGRLVIGPTKTGKRRTIVLPDFLTTLLAEHLAEYPSESGLVFTASGGGPLHHRNFMRRHFKPAVVRAGLPEALRFHDLRHTCAALLIANGRHMEEIKDYLGHSSIRVTSDRYGHLFPQARRSMAEGLHRTWAGSQTGL